MIGFVNIDVIDGKFSKFPGIRRAQEKAEASKGRMIVKNVNSEAREAFLTHSYFPKNYSRRRILQEAVRHYKKVFQPMRYILSIELHRNSAPHLHSYLSFNKPEEISVKTTTIPFGAFSKPAFSRPVTRDEKSQMDIIRYILKRTEIVENIENLPRINRQLANDRDYLWCESPLDDLPWIATNMEEINYF